MMNFRKCLFALVLGLTLLGCGEQQSLRPVAAPAEKMIAQQDWAAALSYYRERLRENPDDAELLRGYYAVVEATVDHFTDEARRYVGLNDIQTAEARLNQGLFFVSDSTLLKDELARVHDMKRARKLYRDGAAAARLGRGSQAISKLEQALALDPEYGQALELLEELYQAETQSRGIQPIRLRTSAPVTLTFRDAGFKEAMLALGQAYGVNMIFDAGLENRAITLFAEDVTFVQAFELLLKSNRAFYRRLGKNSVVIASDTPEARAEYEDYIVRTIYLESSNAVEMAELISRSLGMQTVTASETANTVTVRDSRERVQLAEQLIAANDRTPAEVIIDVEILEVNRTKSEQLGLDFGSQITVSPPSLTVQEFDSINDIQNAVDVSALSLPAVTLRYFKQDVDAKTLASPRIRTLDKTEALIHIGDRVPLRSSTIVDATGQTRTTFEYRDVGIKLNVVPEVKLNRSVVVALDLEISSLGENLGTTDEPAFAIGTRNVSTRMVLDDTETAIIGGLIRDEDRQQTQRVPGLGRIPAVGRIFQSNDGQGSRRDILLTLTPRIIRGRDVPGPAASRFFSGSGARVTTERQQDFLMSRSSTLPTIRLDLTGTPSAVDGVRAPVSLPLPVAPGGVERSGGAQAALTFARSAYETEIDGTIDVVVSASGFAENNSGTLAIRFRPDLVEAMEVRTVGNMPTRIDNSRGEIEIDLNNSIAGAGTKDIATISFRALKQGLSYLIFSNNFGVGPNVQMPDDIELRSSRIIIR